MTLHRAIVPSEILKGVHRGTTIVLPSETHHRLVHVLRVSSSDEVELFDGSGLLVKGCIQSDGTFLTSSAEWSERARIKLVLAQAMIKQEKLEEVVSKGTQLGVHEFLLFDSKHAVVKTTPRTPQQIERLRRVAADASRQSERSDVPKILGPVSFRELLNVATEKKANVFVGEPRKTEKIVDVLKGLDWTKVQEVMLVIGPEGGLSENESDALSKMGALLVRYAPHVLRAETAGLVGMSIIQSFCE